MADDWGNDDNQQGAYGRNTRDKPVYSQSFSRGGRGGKFNRQDDRRGNFRQNQNYQGNDSDDPSSKIIYVDARKIGSVLGRGGSKVKEMEQLSGTRIFVSCEL